MFRYKVLKEFVKEMKPYRHLVDNNKSRFVVDDYKLIWKINFKEDVTVNVRQRNSYGVAFEREDKITSVYGMWYVINVFDCEVEHDFGTYITRYSQKINAKLLVRSGKSNHIYENLLGFTINTN